jgi:hypothetical protein
MVHGFKIHNDHMKWRMLAVVLFLFLLAIGLIAFRIIQEQGENWNISQCQRNLRALANEFRAYRGLHGGQYPKTFDEVLSESNIGIANTEYVARKLSCPGFNDAMTQPTMIKRMGFLYVDWSKRYGTNDTPTNYPLLYDLNPENHHGKGINIALTGGIVFWDAHCAWIHRFGGEHPGFLVPLKE